MKLSSQTIVLSVALAAAAATTAGVNASSRDLTRNRKTTTRERRIRNLFQVESATTTLEEIVQINDAELVRELMGHTMSMSMPSMPSGDSEDETPSTDMTPGESPTAVDETTPAETPSTDMTPGESPTTVDETTPAETPSTDMTPGESPTAVGEPTASGTSGSTPLEAPTVGEPDFIAPTSGETPVEPSSASRQNVAIAATITIAFMVVPFIG